MNTDASAPEALAKAPPMIRGKENQLEERKQEEASMLLEFLDRITEMTDRGLHSVVDFPWESLGTRFYQKRLVVNQDVAANPVELAQRSTLSLKHNQIALFRGNNIEGTVFTVKRNHTTRVLAMENVPENDFFLKFMYVSKSTPKDDMMELVVSMALTLSKTPNVAQLYNWFIVDSGPDAGQDFTQFMRPSEMDDVRKQLAEEKAYVYHPEHKTVYRPLGDGKVPAQEEWRLWFRRKMDPFFTFVLITQNGGDISLYNMYSDKRKDLSSKRANSQLDTYWTGLLGSIYSKPNFQNGANFTIDFPQIRLKSTVAYMMGVLEKFQDIPRPIRALHKDLHSNNVRSQRVIPYGSEDRTRPVGKAPYTMLQKDKTTDWINWADLDSQEYTLIDFGHAQVTLSFAQTAFHVRPASVAARGLNSILQSTKTHNYEFHVWYDVFRFAFFMCSAVLRFAHDYAYANYKESFNLAKYRAFMQTRCTDRTLSFIMAVMTPPRLWFRYWDRHKHAKTPEMRHFGRATFGIEAILAYLAVMKLALQGQDNVRTKILSNANVMERLRDSSQLKDGHLSAFEAVNQHFNDSLNQLVSYSVKLNPANERTPIEQDRLQSMLTEFYKYNSPAQVRQWSWFVE